MKIVREVNEMGEVRVKVDEVEVKRFGESDWDWSRHEKIGMYGRGLTGHTGGWGKELFAVGQSSVRIEYGCYTRNFSWVDYRTGSAKEILEKLHQRIADVKKWIAECKSLARSETAEICETRVEVLKKIDDTSDVMYRGKDGKFYILK